ncbi:MAG: cytochrome bc complex cytochrome b subunit [Gemmatimonadota bacterium]
MAGGPRWRWLKQLGADFRASIDPNLLVLARFLGLLYGRIDRRLPTGQALRQAWGRRLPAHVGWRHAFGGIAYLLFMVLVASGVLLAVHYRPSAGEAYASVRYITSDVPFGWLVRDAHVWAANLVVIAVLAHMARVFFAGAYKPPRETNWLVGLLLLFVVGMFGLSGFLLPWDQWAYWTTTEVLESVRSVPLVGPGVAAALMGDVFVSGATLSRFFAVHVIVLPWLAFALLIFHFMMVRSHGIAPPARAGGDAGPGDGGDEDRSGVRFFPTHLLRSFIVSVLVLATVLSLAVLHPRPMGDPATPFRTPVEIQSSWILVDVALALARYLGPWGIGMFVLLGLALILLPLFDRRPERRLNRRPLAAALGAVFLLLFVAAWLAGRSIRSVSPEVGPPAGDRVGAVAP